MRCLCAAIVASKDAGDSFADIPDGASNAIMGVEGNPATAVVCTKPGDLHIDANKPMAGPRGLRPGGGYDDPRQVLPRNMRSNDRRSVILQFQPKNLANQSKPSASMQV
jgi:hypothetical protein